MRIQRVLLVWALVPLMASITGCATDDDGPAQEVATSPDVLTPEDTASAGDTALPEDLGAPADGTLPEEDGVTVSDSRNEPGTIEVAKSEKARIESPLLGDGDKATFTENNRAFAFDLYQQLTKNEDGNLFYSPHSISTALAMTWAGAKGTTATQMAEAMHFALPSPELHSAFNWLDQELAQRNELPEGYEGDAFSLKTTNAIWGQKGFSFVQDFLDLLAEHYGAGLLLLDFASAPDESRVVINEWVAEQTEDRIKDLLPEGSISSDTKLVLTNAIYFLAPWMSQFEPEKTEDGTFEKGDGTEVTVSMMKQHIEAPFAAGESYRAMEMRYNGNQLSMVIILPDTGKFEELEAQLTGDFVGEILGKLQNAAAELAMPKFEFAMDFSVKKMLLALGMVDAFGGNADFSGMSASKLAIADVIHKAFVKVDEKGTEAAAATAVIVGPPSVPPQLEPFVMDRPFIFLIRDIPTRQVLFVGRVVDPSGG